MNWDEHYMDIAESVASESTNEGSRVGAVIYHPITRAVVGSGCNTLVRGLDPNDRRYHESGLIKQKVWEHAERNALYNALRHGMVATNHLGMAVNWFPCADCARALIQCGFSEIIAIRPNWMDQKWGQDWVLARTMLDSSKVHVRMSERDRQEFMDEKIQPAGAPASFTIPFTIRRTPNDVA